ncbi:hypothetical protein AVEN_11395-1 [Araneus ventricosus]|uniref:Uncharacterized protein n=1 Tax=Araneus ventricosus TaxID=182803 RepID=A0A4Y2IPJ5_ARAVE|nr:hypothetical protein AVEN_11395-1 [Araneus ventricosus]
MSKSVSQSRKRPRWPTGKVSASEAEISRFQPDSIEDPSCIRPVTAGYNGMAFTAWVTLPEEKTPDVHRSFHKSYIGGQTSAGVPAQVSSDRGLKLRGLSQNSFRVASKRDVNITKRKLAITEKRSYGLRLH